MKEMSKIDAAALLKEAGLKVTRQRQAILELLYEQALHLSAEDIYLELKKRGEEFGLATVYRTLAALEQRGILNKSEQPGSASQCYFPAPHCHQHQLICTGCGKIIYLEDCPAENYLRTLEETYHFQITGHSFQIYGLCPGCRKEERHV